MRFYPHERLAIVVDGPTMWSTGKMLGFDIDYQRLRELYEREATLIRCLYFTHMDEAEEFNPLRPLVDWLDFNGWQVTTNPARVWMDSQNRRHVSGDFEVELAIAVMEMAPTVDHVILATGDGTYIPLVDALQRMGKRVTVLSTIKGARPCCSEELRRAADGFADLYMMQSSVERIVKTKEVA